MVKFDYALCSIADNLHLTSFNLILKGQFFGHMLAFLLYL
jgi:hypothetical protein